MGEAITSLSVTAGNLENMAAYSTPSLCQTQGLWVKNALDRRDGLAGKGTATTKADNPPQPTW